MLRRRRSVSDNGKFDDGTRADKKNINSTINKIAQFTKFMHILFLFFVIVVLPSEF